MSRRDLNAQVRRELHLLLAQGVLDTEQVRALLQRYPVGRWNVASLIRWFTLLGALGMVVGVGILVPRWIDVHDLAEGGLFVATLGLLAGGVWLRTKRDLPRTGRALELMGALALQALSMVVAHYHATGTHHWPSLILLDTVALLVLAYALQNPLVLIDALVNGYVWFGGATGYDGGMYWLSMTYPVRYLAAGVAAAALGLVHARVANRWQALSAVWLHVGVLVMELSLWFLALFGYFTSADSVRWDDTQPERLAFSALWAIVSAGFLWVGIQRQVRMLRGYGWTFLFINAFTFYSQFVFARSAELWFAHLLVLGGSLVGIGVWVERKRNAAKLGVDL